MVRTPCCKAELGLKKGAWTPEEDQKLVSYVNRHGEGGWRTLPEKAGLKRCGKSCRLRWANYLRPDIKRGEFTEDEERSIISLHALHGNKLVSLSLSTFSFCILSHYFVHFRLGISGASGLVGLVGRRNANSEGESHVPSSIAAIVSMTPSSKAALKTIGNVKEYTILSACKATISRELSCCSSSLVRPGLGEVLKGF
ncbi:hypothetical protein F2Q70_00040189 [Brassica cretica]|uniref:Uncharacterized protein n=1 Tax=Brassica cretica TaxID=69181 RepID=A0A8S9K9L0_BRACR|nr:hypothetical protein F2Q70_00040189 [Brassica cretica]